MALQQMLLAEVSASAPPGPTIAFRSKGSIDYGSRTSPTGIPAPAGIVNGDILVATLACGAGSTPPSVTPPTGFAAFGTITSVNAGGFFVDMYVFWKRAASEAVAFYDFTYTGLANTNGIVSAYSGCLASGTPLGATQNNTGDGTTSTGLGITTTAANSWLLYMAHNWTAAGTLTPPTGMTERYDNLVFTADQLISVAGATGNRTQANGNGSFDPWATRMVELLAA